MAKWFAAYWLIGCVFVGFAFAKIHERCPNDGLGRPIDAMAVVATWPIAIVAAIVPHGEEYRVECKRVGG